MTMVMLSSEILGRRLSSPRTTMSTTAGNRWRRSEGNPVTGELFEELSACIRKIIDEFIDQLAKLIADAIAALIADHFSLSQVVPDELGKFSEIIIVQPGTLAWSDLATIQHAPAPSSGLMADVREIVQPRSADPRCRVFPSRRRALNAPYGFTNVARAALITMALRLGSLLRRGAGRSDSCLYAKTRRYRGAALS